MACLAGRVSRAFKLGMPRGGLEQPVHYGLWSFVSAGNVADGRNAHKKRICLGQAINLDASWQEFYQL